MSGVSFIEIVFVLGLLSLLFTIVVPVGLSYMHTYAVLSERDMLVGALTIARSSAMANVSRQPHGVYLSQAGYTIFSGSDFDSAKTSNRFLPSSWQVEKAADHQTIIFSPLSGATTETEVVLQRAGHSVHVSVNSEGVIE